MKKNFLLAFAISTIALSSAVFGSVIIQSEALNQSSLNIKAELSSKINSSFSVEELPNGEHDDRHFGTVFFGSYPQQSDDNAKTPIEWYILDKRGNNAILMSKYVIATHSYDRKDSVNTWNNTRMRSWLNGIFLSDAFSQAEQELILSNPYRNTGRVFLLNSSEAKHYFGSNREGLSVAVPTSKALSENNKGSHRYWLEGSADSAGSEYIHRQYDGETHYLEVTEKIGVRPCIVVSYDVDPALQALFAQELEAYKAQLAAQTAAQTAASVNVNPVTGEMIIQSQANETTSIIYESTRTTQTYKYTTEDDDDNTKSFIINIVLPVYAGGNPVQVDMMNNLVKTTCFEILKSYSGDYIEERLNSAKKQLSVIPKGLDDHGNSLYSVEYEISSRRLCTMYFDLRTGTCYADVD